MPSEKSLENLILFQEGNQFAKGHGRPKGKSLTTILKEALEMQVTKDETKKASEWIVAALIKSSMDGDIRAIKEIFDRIEGKPLQTINQTNHFDPAKNGIDYSSLTKEQLEKFIEDNTRAEGEDDD